MKNKIIASIVVVVIITILVFSATYAYWAWTSNKEQQTNVQFIVENPGLNASINGGAGGDFNNLMPTVTCPSSNTMQKEVTIQYENKTTTKAKVTANLFLTALTPTHRTLSSDDKSHLHWSITTSANNECSSSPLQQGTFQNLSNGSIITSLVIDDIMANTSSTSKTYYLNVWLDDSYSGLVNEGNVVNDPMQELTVSLEWSGKIEQTT